ncbi:MAG: N-acetyltransferase [Caulobacterales bacterium]|nr:N-acetyltransferase [Caulobacterales bacterium]
MQIRAEQPGDVVAIRAVTQRAFDGHPHSDGTEPDIIERLRAAGSLTVSLVALQDDRIIGHIALSPVDWAGGAGWFGLGPVSIDPAHQRAGVGSALITAALDQIRKHGAAGCVLAGDPAYYRRFGFRVDPRWTYDGLPPEYFMALAFAPTDGSGPVRYHSAFG